MKSLHNIFRKPRKADNVPKLRDTNKGGVLDKKELMCDLRPSKLLLTREEIKEIFLEHDIDGDGCLNMSELTKAFSFLGSLLPWFKAYHGLTCADDDCNGLISEDELDKLINYFEKTNKKSLK